MRAHVGTVGNKAADSAAKQGTGKEVVDFTVKMSFGAVKTAMAADTKAIW